MNELVNLDVVHDVLALTPTSEMGEAEHVLLAFAAELVEYILNIGFFKQALWSGCQLASLGGLGAGLDRGRVEAYFSRLAQAFPF